MPDTPPQTAHHPATVGSTFMRQYYHLLAKEPESLHRFYKDESTWCHGVGSHMQDAISGQKAINDEILRRGYAGARVDLDIGSIDCQASLNGGVLVLVTGVMTLASSPLPKPFVQTFFLAVQPKGYFVLNDCLRFLELPAPTVEVAATATTTVAPPVIKTTSAPATPAQKAAIGTPVAASSSPAAKTPVKAATPVASPVKVASPKPVVASPVKKAASPVKVATPKPSETKPATPASPAAKTEPEPAAVKPPASPVKQQPAAPAKPAEPAAPAAPKTWAALFSSGAAAPAATPAPKAAPKPTPASPAAEAAAPAASAAPASQEKEKEKKRYSSIYIRDLPAQVKDSDLRELFKSYGEIANITVPAGRGFAFVDYYHEEHMRAVLADTKEFKLFDKVIQVDERSERNSKDRSGFRSDSRGGRGGRGAPKSGRGERKEREDGKERRPQESKEGGAAAANGKPSNGPRSSTPTDRREKGGRRSGGKEDAAGRGARAE